MANWHGSIRTQHIGGEALLIDLGEAVILSDHPLRFGGSDKGPMPGDLMKGSLAASAALALGAAAEAGELQVSSIAVRCSSTLAYEDVNGPLKTLIYVPDFTLDIAMSGSLDEAQIAKVKQIVLATPVARALAGDIAVEETNVFIAGDAARKPVGGMALLAEKAGSLDPERKPDIQSPATAMVEYIGGGRALINWAHSSCLVARPGSAAAGSTSEPESLLLASLAACTTVFTSRAAARTGAAVDLTVFCEGSIGDGANVPGRIVKRLEIGGDVTAEQREAIAFSSDHCALGETLRRPAQVIVNVHVGAAQGDRIGAQAGAREILDSLGGADCDDGACCVPQASA